MRVGIITAEIEQTNGWAQVSHSLIGALRDIGLTLRVVGAEGTAGADAALLPKLATSERGVLPRQLLALSAVRRELKDCEVVHTLVEPFAPLGVMAAARRPHLLTVHGTFAALPLMRRWPVGALYRWAFDRSVSGCVSRYTQSVLAKAAPDAKSVVINNAVDAAGLAASAAAVEPFPKTGPVVLFVGGVKRRKGALELAQAMASVREQIPGVLCVIAGSHSGEPAYVAQIRAEIDRLGLPDTVRLTGRIDHHDLMRWYRTADLFVVPSMNDGWRFEGFGLVHLEAAAFGLPAIGTRECGAADAIDDDETGLLVSQGNIAAELPAAILRILGDDALRTQMGAAAKAKAERMTWTAVAEQYATLYAAELMARL